MTRAFIVRAEVQRAHRRCGLVAAALALDRIDDDDSVHERGQRHPDLVAQAGEFLLSGVV